MYILVIGCGKVGYYLTKALMRGDHEVLVIDLDPTRVATLVEEMGSIALVGDGGEIGVLREAGAGRAEILIATTGSDANNLVACEVAKHWFKIPRTIALVNNPTNARLFTQLGIDVALNSTEMIMKNIEEELPAHPLVHMMNLDSGRREVVVIKIPPQGKFIGRPLGDISLPNGCEVSLVLQRGADPQRPTDEFILQQEDELICIITQSNEDTVFRILTETA